MAEGPDGTVVCNGGISHFVMRIGDHGPPVILMHEMTGAGPSVLALAAEINQAGYLVHLPVLYGSPGKRSSQAVGFLRARFCLWGELHLFATGRTSPLVGWLRHLVDKVCSDAHPRAAVIGMCMTGSLVFGTVAHAKISAAVAAQPSLPFALPLPIVRGRLARSVGLRSKDMEDAADSTTPLMAIRFADDWMTPDERMAVIRERMGSDDCQATSTDEGVRITSCGRATLVDLPGDDHATLTEHRHPQAVAIVLDFLAQHHPAP